MAKDRKKTIHIHSSIADRQPTPGSLEYGELGVNYNAGNEFISTKNSEDKVVRFSSDEQVVTIMEKKEVIPYSGVVDNIHLDTNRSNIEIKLNQVVAGNTVKHDVVNGAKDIDNQLVNPSDDGGLTNGAGFAIDMSAYALTGGNPTFSSITTTDKATLNGVTNVNGNSLNTNVISDLLTASTYTANIGTEAKTVTGDSASNISGNSVTNVGGNVTISAVSISEAATSNICSQAVDTATLYGLVKTNIGINCDETATAATTTVKGNNVIVHAAVSNLGLTAKQNILESSESDIVLTANSAICASAGDSATLYGVSSTNIGTNCDNSSASTVTNIYGGAINVTGPTTISGTCTVGDTLYIKEGLEKSLTWTYGDVKSASSGSTNFKADGSLVIPKCASDINRATLSYSYGDVHDKVGTEGTYDPGDNCTNTASDSIVIPTCLENLTNWSDGCFSINNDVCISGDVTATGSFYSTSDERKKENIKPIDYDKEMKSRNIPLKSFNYKEDETKRTLYGVVAQDVEAAGLNELVHIDGQGVKAVDYTSFLILRIAYLEKMMAQLHAKVAKLEEEINKK